MKDVMSPAEVGAVLGLSRETVMRYIASGRIRGSAVAGTVRKRYVVTRENLQLYLDSCAVSPVEQTAPAKPRIVRGACPILERFGY